MKRKKLSVLIAGTAMSVGALAIAPVTGEAQARSAPHSSIICTRLVGVAHHQFAVVAVICPALGGNLHVKVHHRSPLSGPVAS